MRVLAVILGVILFLIAFWQMDAQRRAKGRGRLNRILTDFGGGSFEEGVKSSFRQHAHGCLAQLFGTIGLVLIIGALCVGGE